MPIRRFVAPIVVLALSHSVRAETQFTTWRAFRDSSIQDHGFQWAEVGHAGNADWVGVHPPNPFVTVRTGGVQYRYRIARTEVTGRQYFEFVQAYAPHVDPEFAFSSQFTGNSIHHVPGSGYVLSPATADWGVEVGWRFAARYVNWLHNDKATEEWAFESGVYDTSTFGEVDESFQITDQAQRSEGARFFLPTRDEWAKAVYFDPDRFGEDQEGYWLWSYTSDTAPIAGDPGTPGAQTNAGTGDDYNILSYPNAQTAWGLYDASGSVREWLETMTGNQGGRRVASTDEGDNPVGQFDRISGIHSAMVTSRWGIRIASVVPAPGTSVLALSGFAYLSARRRRSAQPAW